MCGDVQNGLHIKGVTFTCMLMNHATQSTVKETTLTRSLDHAGEQGSVHCKNSERCDQHIQKLQEPKMTARPHRTVATVSCKHSLPLQHHSMINLKFTYAQFDIPKLKHITFHI